MTAAINLALRQQSLGVEFRVTQDDLKATPGGAQAGGWPLDAGVNRFTVVASAGDSAMLPSILSGQAVGHCVVINDSGTSLNVYPAVGENLNGVANAAAAVAGNAAAFFTLDRVNSNWKSATL